MPKDFSKRNLAAPQSIWPIGAMAQFFKIGQLVSIVPDWPARFAKLATGEALPKDSLELFGLTFGGFRPSVVLVTNRVPVKDLEV